MVDVDNYAIPSGMTLGSDSLIRHVIRDVLPIEFHPAACVWSLSSSTGLTTDLLKCHLWFWLVEAMTSESVKRSSPRARKGGPGPVHAITASLYGRPDPHRR